MKDEKLKIGIDIDEVVVKTIDGFLDFYNTKYNKNVLFEEIKTYDFCNSLDLTNKELLDLFLEFYDSSHFDNLSLIEGVTDSINHFSKNFEIYFITARPVDIKDKTNEFLKKNFPDISFTLMCASDFFCEENNKELKSKGELCNELGICVMVEDNKKYALDCAKNGVKSFLINKPWNQNHDEHENIIRVNNWKEIIEELKK